MIMEMSFWTQSVVACSSVQNASNFYSDLGIVSGTTTQLLLSLLSHHPLFLLLLLLPYSVVCTQLYQGLAPVCCSCG